LENGGEENRQPSPLTGKPDEMLPAAATPSKSFPIRTAAGRSMVHGGGWLLLRYTSFCILQLSPRVLSIL
ncbi:unnamed protein product, partial [Polarella glacialis]